MEICNVTLVRIVNVQTFADIHILNQQSRFSVSTYLSIHSSIYKCTYIIQYMHRLSPSCPASIMTMFIMTIFVQRAAFSSPSRWNKLSEKNGTPRIHRIIIIFSLKWPTVGGKSPISSPLPRILGCFFSARDQPTSTLTTSQRSTSQVELVGLGRLWLGLFLSMLDLGPRRLEVWRWLFLSLGLPSRELKNQMFDPFDAAFWANYSTF